MEGQLQGVDFREETGDPPISFISLQWATSHFLGIWSVHRSAMDQNFCSSTPLSNLPSQHSYHAGPALQTSLPKAPLSQPTHQHRSHLSICSPQMLLW